MSHRIQNCKQDLNAPQSTKHQPQRGPPARPVLRARVGGGAEGRRACPERSRRAIARDVSAGTAFVIFEPESRPGRHVAEDCGAGSYARPISATRRLRRCFAAPGLFIRVEQAFRVCVTTRAAPSGLTFLLHFNRALTRRANANAALRAGFPGRLDHFLTRRVGSHTRSLGPPRVVGFIAPEVPKLLSQPWLILAAAAKAQSSQGAYQCRPEGLLHPCSTRTRRLGDDSPGT